MTYEEFQEYVRAKCLYETIYSDSDGREILIIQMLAAYALVNRAPKREWVGLTMDDINQFETWFDDEEERKGWVDPALIAKYFDAKLKDKNT